MHIVIYTDETTGEVDEVSVSAGGKAGERLLRKVLPIAQPDFGVPPWAPVVQVTTPPVIPTQLLKEVVECVYVDGTGANKINCIKLVRRLTGWGLKESKDFVETCTPRFMPKPAYDPARPEANYHDPYDDDRRNDMDEHYRR